MKTNGDFMIRRLVKQMNSAVFFTAVLSFLGASAAFAQNVPPACQSSFVAGMTYQKSYSDQHLAAMQSENQELKVRLERLEKYVAALNGNANVQTAESKLKYPLPTDARDE